MSQSELQIIKEILSDKKVRQFTENNLRESLASIGFSELFINSLIEFLNDLSVDEFINKHNEELERIHLKRFFQEIVPDYFTKYVVPEIPASEKVIDIGCGIGVLANLLSQYDKFKKIIGVDLNPYPEWESFESGKIDLKIVKEHEFTDFMAAERPDTAVLTWTLHHMDCDKQERYLKYIHDNLRVNSKIIILEDAYSTELSPETGIQRQNSFMQFDENERHKIMSLYDWIANRILARRKLVPLPFSFRTMEEWGKLFSKNGFENVNQKYIGFPEQRDINTPQSLLVLSST